MERIRCFRRRRRTAGHVEVRAQCIQGPIGLDVVMCNGAIQRAADLKSSSCSKSSTQFYCAKLCLQGRKKQSKFWGIGFLKPLGYYVTKYT